MRMSDIITERILEMLAESEDSIAEIRRNELASTVGCAPSQINYVIASRFTPEQGYIIESRRGGGGYVRISRVRLDRSSAIMHIVNSIGLRLDPMETRIIIENCMQSGLIENRAAAIMSAALSNASLSSVPQEAREYVRAAALKQMLLTQI